MHGIRRMGLHPEHAGIHSKHVRCLSNFKNTYHIDDAPALHDAALLLRVVRYLIVQDVLHTAPVSVDRSLFASAGED